MDDGGSPQNIKWRQRKTKKFSFFDRKREADTTPEEIIEEEIISMVNEGHEQGVLLASEAEMITNIFELGDKEAHDIMIHRKNIVALDASFTLSEALDFIDKEHYSRYPVFSGDIDNIIGVIHIKDMLGLCRKQDAMEKVISDIPDLVREVSYIPETRSINLLFRQMQLKKTHMVIVVDEYGQTSGIVSMEDILEEIVGNILDEHDEEDQMIVHQGEHTYLMDGMASLDEIFEMLEIEDEQGALEDYDTLNGFLISRIDKIPMDDESYEVDAYGYHFHVLKVENKMIKTVKVTKLPPVEKSENEE